MQLVLLFFFAASEYTSVHLCNCYRPWVPRNTVRRYKPRGANTVRHIEIRLRHIEIHGLTTAARKYSWGNGIYPQMQENYAQGGAICSVTLLGCRIGDCNHWVFTPHQPATLVQCRRGCTGAKAGCQLNRASVPTLTYTILLWQVGMA